jgi:hypothetical protein
MQDEKPSQAEGDDPENTGTEHEVLGTGDKPSQAEGEDD